MGRTGLRLALPDWVEPFVAWDAPYADDEERMRLVIALARENVARGTGGPFGAAVFERDAGRLVAVGVNAVIHANNSAFHAEIVALMLAQQRQGSYTLAADGLPAHDLVASCEPCAMCLGALFWSGVTRVVWGAGRADANAIGFDEGPVFPQSHRYLEERGITLVPDVLRAEAVAVLRDYHERGGAIYNA